MGIWLACDDPWYRDCLIESLSGLGRSVAVADAETVSPPDDASVVVVNHDARVFDVFAWARTFAGDGLSGEGLPMVALFDPADRDRAADAARSLPLFACHVKPVPNEVVTLSVTRALEAAARRGAADVPSTVTTHEERDVRRDVLRAFV